MGLDGVSVGQYHTASSPRRSFLPLGVFVPLLLEMRYILFSVGGKNRGEVLSWPSPHVLSQMSR